MYDNGGLTDMRLLDELVLRLRTAFANHGDVALACQAIGNAFGVGEMICSAISRVGMLVFTCCYQADSQAVDDLYCKLQDLFTRGATDSTIQHELEGVRIMLQ